MILGGPFCQERSHAELALAAIRGGARIVQLREKEGDSRKLVEIATGVCEVCRAHGAFFIVNDRVDIAIASGADGVHLGDEDLPPQLARAVLGPEKIIGVSVANLDQAKAAEAAGADYLGLGPVYPTSTKECKVLPCGPQVVAEVVSAVSIPVFAIGGITPENALPVLEAGAAGVAVISAVFGKPEPERACREFLEVFSRVEKGGRRT
ncbi:MAG: thiamine phosphate synthase [Bacillota bacterium]|nr:thiamine phosphate synthase [Bacillota bacterium]